MKHLKSALLLVCLTVMVKTSADNPLVPNVGMADPHMYVFDGKVYLFATRDASPTAKQFTMPDWNIWTSDDLIHWKLERTIKPSETYMGKSDRCWATETAFKNGKYYFYFSNGNTDTGVMVGESPAGPYKDALGKPMLPADLTPVKEYDPTVIVDDDGAAFIAFGHHRLTDPDYYYMIAKLADDMISLAEEPKEVVINKGVSGVLGGNDKPNLHKRNGIYYLSAGSHYATSKNIYGPYTTTGNSGNNEYGLDAKAHGNYFQWNKQWFHTWCHFHLGKDVARYRESYLTYLHYKDNGEMVSDMDFLKDHFKMGVGQYDAEWDKIQAEWYMAADLIQKKESPNGGFEIQEIKDNAHLYFPNVKNMENKREISFHVASAKGGTIEIYTDDADGQLLGRCKIKKTGSVVTYKDFTCKLKESKGVKNIYLKFKGKGDDVMHLDWFSFN